MTPIDAAHTETRFNDGPDNRVPSSDPGSSFGYGLWVGPEARPLAGRVWLPAGEWTGAGILLLPAVCYEYWSAFLTLRLLAEACARSGHLVLRLDYDGYGDSAGEQTDPGRWSEWNRAVDIGVAQLRDWGAERIGIAGIRIGATLALLGGERNRAAAIAAVLPVTSGRRYVRSVNMLRDEGELPPEIEPGTISACGAILPVALQTELGGVDLTDWDSAPAPEVLVIERSNNHEAAVERMVGNLRSVGATVTLADAGGFDRALDEPEAAIADEPLAIAGRWIDRTLGAGQRAEPAAPISVADLRLRETAEFSWRGGTIHERTTYLGADRLYGVETLPVGAERATVLFIETAVVHVGLGRAWVEFARALALDGYHAVRADFRGLGDSPDDGFLPSRPNADNAVHYFEDLTAMVAELRRRGHRQIVVCGLCFGGWVALRGVESADTDGAIAVNPPLFWERGDPLEALIERTRRRRAPEVAHFKAHGAELERTVPHETAELLVSLRQRGKPNLLVHSDDDDGLEFLRDRVPAGWAQALASDAFWLAEIAGLHHSMFNYWRRAEVLDAIRRFLAEQAG